MKRKIKDRILIQLDYIWRNLSKHSNEWVSEEVRQNAVTKYHAKTRTKNQSIINKMMACVDVIVNDFTNTFDMYLPLLCYLTIIYEHSINTGKRFVKEVLKNEMPLDVDAFATLCNQIYQVNVECINACPKEV